MVVTVDSLRNSKRASGYNYVSNARSRGGLTPLWCAKKGRFTKGSAAGDWHGPCRKDPREAAQDYCDYVNGREAPPGTVLVSAGHEYEIDQRDSDPEYQAALGVLRDRRAQKQGKQGYVYLIVEDLPGDALRYGKIGYSVNPRKRVAELQTGNPRKLRLLYAMHGTEDDERALQAKYLVDNVLQEWFLVSRELLLEFPHTADEGGLTV